MKIEGPNRTSSASGTKGKGKASSADGSFGDLITGGAQEARSAAATHSIASIDSLLAAQSVEDPTARAARKRMQVRADNILTELENMRIALLTGTLTVGHVVDIADVVAAHREKIMDPRLHSILDEIDLRAQIEIAKLCKALDNQG
jgi:cysteine sulfinate desulfinase/cysteine desulfurase-like protein